MKKIRPLRRVKAGVWKSRDGRWTFLIHYTDPIPSRWFAYLDGDDEPSNTGLGHVTLAEVVQWVEIDAEQSTVETQKARPLKPLGHRAYGSIPHLPGSRRGPADKGLDPQQARILLTKARDKHDLITVEEKLDGSNVAVAKIGGNIVPLIRAGYEAVASKWIQHRHFATWALENYARFNDLLIEGERCVGEWLMEAHGTRYNLPHEPFVIFDIMYGQSRASAEVVRHRCEEHAFINPRLIHVGGPITIEAVVKLLEPSGHGALDPVEGAVWRCERNGVVDFLGKYVRPDKVDGCYLECNNAGVTIWNWTPSVPNASDSVTASY